MVEGSSVPATDKAYKQARQLRRTMSLPETLLWQHLRRTKPRIRRQHPLGHFVLDFYCAEAKLVIEIDGYAHDTGTRPERDQARARWLKQQGLGVLRIKADEVLRDPLGWADAIVRMCRAS